MCNMKNVMVGRALHVCILTYCTFPVVENLKRHYLVRLP